MLSTALAFQETTSGAPHIGGELSTRVYVVVLAHSPAELQAMRRKATLDASARGDPLGGHATPVELVVRSWAGASGVNTPLPGPTTVKNWPATVAMPEIESVGRVMVIDTRVLVAARGRTLAELRTGGV
jgi:hypothetical protein